MADPSDLGHGKKKENKTMMKYHQNTSPAHHWTTGNFASVLKKESEVYVRECCHLLYLNYFSLSGVRNTANKERGWIIP